MRTQPPVTQKEVDYDKTMTLMSVTDTDSRIVYANEAFLQLSGYSAEELIGQPHNIVRHPDMPKAAFLDMWHTLREGKSWTGLVKNRNKNGDHYWVRANATPMMHDGVCTGYISVRTKPSREEIQATERLYADVKAGRAKGIRLYRGLVVRTGLMAWASLTQRISVATRIHLAIGFSWLVYAMLGTSLGLEWGQWAVLATLSLLCAGLADFWLQRQITAPLQLLMQQAQAMASGNTEKRVHLNRADEIGLIMRSVNQCGLNLRSLVDDVASQVSGIYQASEHMEHSSSSLAERSEQSASGVVQTAAAMDELASTIQQNAATSDKARELAITASDAAVHGGEVVSKVVSTMDAISTHSKRIADIIGVIDGIAFQTNILALNAAVEAARAGEQGRGFAVVASEVRNLAQRSASAAKEIKELIETSVDAVEGGTKLVDDAGKSMQNIVQRVKHVTNLIADISSASGEQSIGVAQACEGVAQLDSATQQNTGLITAEAEQARSLMERSNRLVAAIGVYQGRKKEVQLF